MAGTPEQARINGRKGGRPKGAVNAKTLERMKVNEAVQQRILRNADRIIDSQLQLTKGLSMLYRIDTEIFKGRKVRKKPVLVVDPEEIAAFLDGEFGDGESVNTETEYYYMTAIPPSNQAADSLLNRGLGRPVESIDLTSGGKKLPTPIINVIRRNNSDPKDKVSN